VSRLLLPMVFFLTLGSALRVNQHVNIDVVFEKLSPRKRNLALAVGCTLAAAFFALVAVLGARVTLAAYETGERLSGAIEWPVWWFAALVPIGMAPLVVRLALRACVSVRRALSNAAPIDLAPRQDEGPEAC